jgi:hypothetical protein
VPRAFKDIWLIPIGAGICVQHRPQAIEIKRGVGGRGSFAEEPPKLRIVGKRAKPREFQLSRDPLAAQIDDYLRAEGSSRPRSFQR